MKFSEMENAVFFRAKKLMERSYLLITETFFFWTFRRWEIWSFFRPKSWWKDNVYLVFLSFLWYLRTWKIWFFMQCLVWILIEKSFFMIYFKICMAKKKCFPIVEQLIIIYPKDLDVLYLRILTQGKRTVK